MDDQSTRPDPTDRLRELYAVRDQVHRYLLVGGFLLVVAFLVAWAALAGAMRAEAAKPRPPAADAARFVELIREDLDHAATCGNVSARSIDGTTLSIYTRPTESAPLYLVQWRAHDDVLTRKVHPVSATTCAPYGPALEAGDVAELYEPTHSQGPERFTTARACTKTTCTTTVNYDLRTRSVDEGWGADVKDTLTTRPSKRT